VDILCIRSGNTLFVQTLLLNCILKSPRCGAVYGIELMSVQEGSSV